MCGRFTRSYTWAKIAALYRLMAPTSNVQPNFNVCPTDEVDVVVRGRNERSVVPMRWGLIPSWWRNRLRKWESPVQCTFRHNRDQADVSGIIPEASMPDACVRLL